MKPKQCDAFEAPVKTPYKYITHWRLGALRAAARVRGVVPLVDDAPPAARVVLPVAVLRHIGAAVLLGPWVLKKKGGHVWTSI